MPVDLEQAAMLVVLQMLAADLTLLLTVQQLL